MLRRIVLALSMIWVTVPAVAMPLLHSDRRPVAQAVAMDCHRSAKSATRESDGEAPVAPHDCVCHAAYYGARLARLPQPSLPYPAPLPLIVDGRARPRAGPDAPPPKS